MREKLVSYLLGELDADEVAQLNARLDSDPALRDQLDHIRRCMALAGGDEECCEAEEIATDDGPPSGLADRTCESVHDLVLGLSGQTTAAKASTSASDLAPRRCPFTLVDAGVTAGVILALGMMLLPALYESRVSAQRLACENNLREIGRAMQQYSEEHGGYLPHVHPGENAGVVMVRLAESGVIDRDQLTERLVCPASQFAAKRAEGQAEVYLPTYAEWRKADAQQKATWRVNMAGGYAPRLGYMSDSLYLPVRFQNDSRRPMLSDAPVRDGCRLQSFNHGGSGQNVVFQDGHVEYRVDSMLADANDNFFTNTLGRAAAGQGWNDVVLVRSEVTPGVMQAGMRQGSTAQQSSKLRRSTLRIEATRDGRLRFRIQAPLTQAIGAGIAPMVIVGDDHSLSPSAEPVMRPVSAR